MLGAWRAPLLNVGLGSLSGSSTGLGCVSRVPVPEDGSCSPRGAPCSHSGVSASSMGSGVSLRGAGEAGGFTEGKALLLLWVFPSPSIFETDGLWKCIQGSAAGKRGQEGGGSPVMSPSFAARDFQLLFPWVGVLEAVGFYKNWLLLYARSRCC